MGFREAVARRRIGDLPGALSAVDRALHELATGPYDGPTRTFVNEQLRQERERILGRSTGTDGHVRSSEHLSTVSRYRHGELQKWMGQSM